MSDHLTHPGHRFLDATFVSVLCAVGFLPLSTSFAGVGWMVMGAIAVVTGIVLAERVAAWRWPGTLLILVVLLAYVVIGTAAPSISTDFSAAAPSPDGLADLFANTMKAWGELIGTLPRVDSTGRVILIPLVLGLVASAASMGLAAMTRSAGMPVVPVAAMLAVSLVLGRGETDLQAATGLGFGVLSLLWVTVRGRRAADGPGGPGGNPGRQLVAGALVLALAAGLAPALAGSVAGETTRLKLRETAALGLDTTEIATPLDNFRRFTRQQAGDPDNVHDAVLMRVRGAERGDRLRFAVLDWYDGEKWRPNPDRSPRDSQARYLRLSSTLDNPAPGEDRSVEVEIRKRWRLKWVPTIGALQSFEFLNFASTGRRDELTYNPATSTALLGVLVRGVDDYSFTAKLADDRLTRAMIAAGGVDERLYQRASYLEEIAAAYRDREPTPMGALFAAAAALKRTGRYSDGASDWEARRYPPGHGIDRLDQQFLHAAQMVGNDEQYAATMALLAIRLGIPARVVVGAKVPRAKVIRGRNVQAWVEVQLDDGSWRTLPTERFMGKRPPKRKLPPVLQPQFSDWQPPPPAPTDPPLDQKKEPETTKEKPENKQSEEDGRDLPWWLLVVVLLVAGVPLTKFVRRRRRRGRSRLPSRVAGAWDELVDHARDLGVEWQPGLTRPQEAHHVGAPVALAERIDGAIFTDRELTEVEVAAFWAEIDQGRRERAREVPAWRRVLAPLNPITLLRRR